MRIIFISSMTIVDISKNQKKKEQQQNNRAVYELILSNNETVSQCAHRKEHCFPLVSTTSLGTSIQFSILNCKQTVYR